MKLLKLVGIVLFIEDCFYNKVFIWIILGGFNLLEFIIDLYIDIMFFINI